MSGAWRTSEPKITLRKARCRNRTRKISQATRSTAPANRAKIVAMNRTAGIVGSAQTLVVALFCLGVARHSFPLGVPGEWEWQRLASTVRLDLVAIVFAGLAVLAFATFAATGARSLARHGSPAREAAWLAALAVASVFVQAVVQEGAPEGYGLAKWVLALKNIGSSGYHTVARSQMPLGLGRFLKDYPSWIAQQDSLHIGTHPPGLFVVARVLGEATRSDPDLARWVVDHAPGSVGPSIRAAQGMNSLSRDEAAALVLTGALTLVASALTVVPLYLLARAGGSAVLAWATAALWPLMPAAILFQPTADTAFPLLSIAAMAASAWAVRSHRAAVRRVLAFGAGILLAVGMQLTLVYLAVGLVVAMILLGSPKASAGVPFRLVLVVATGLGFVLTTASFWWATTANPLAIWWINQGHHSQFYRDYPRSGLSWAGVNLVESAASIGWASAVWAVLGFFRPRSIPTATWAALAVLAILTVTGRSLSEVARLWLPMYPVILLAAGSAWNKLGLDPVTLGWTVSLVGFQVLFLQAIIQVVYPV